MTGPLAAVVEHYLREWDSSGWARAYHGLVELGPQVVPELARHFTLSSDPRLRPALVELAAHLRAAEALALFESALQDEAPEVWKQALDGLVGLASPASIL